jgi:hypothetical protein
MMMLRVTACQSLPSEIPHYFYGDGTPKMDIWYPSCGCDLGRTPVEERKHDNTRTRNRPFGAGLYDRLCSPEAKGKKAIKI